MTFVFHYLVLLSDVSLYLHLLLLFVVATRKISSRNRLSAGMAFTSRVTVRTDIQTVGMFSYVLPNLVSGQLFSARSTPSTSHPACRGGARPRHPHSAIPTPGFSAPRKHAAYPKPVPHRRFLVPPTSSQLESCLSSGSLWFLTCHQSAPSFHPNDLLRSPTPSGLLH